MSERGDTIVEVLFAMVVIGISLAAAFGIANRSLQISRASQERTEAQKIAETQIELVKIVLSSDSTDPGLQAIKTPAAQNFCLVKSSTSTIEKYNVNSSGEECVDFSPLGSANQYDIEVESQNVVMGRVTQYRVSINWDRIGTNSSEQGELIMYYRPGYISTYHDFHILRKTKMEVLV